MAMQIDPDDLPGMARVEYREPRGRLAVGFRRANQRMGHADLVRMGLVMSAEMRLSPLELVEQVALGSRTMSGQQLRSCIAALPLRHERLRSKLNDPKVWADAREITDEQLQAIIERAEEQSANEANASDGERPMLGGA